MRVNKWNYRSYFGQQSFRFVSEISLIRVNNRAAARAGRHSLRRVASLEIKRNGKQ